MRLYNYFCLCLLLALPIFAKNTEPNLKTVLQNLQKNYNKTTSFSADFTQTFRQAVLNKSDTSFGSVKYKKPGLMRWDYKKPKEKSFIIDGKSLWIYQPLDKLAMVDRCFKADGLSTSISFLWGLGNLSKEFNTSWFSDTIGDEKDFHVLLTPKKPNGIYQKLILVIDPVNYQVKQSIVIDTQGNINQLIFSNIQLNTIKSNDLFSFKPPTQVQISTIPGTCSSKP